MKVDNKVNPNALASQESTLSSSSHPEKHKTESTYCSLRLALHLNSLLTRNSEP